MKKILMGLISVLYLLSCTSLQEDLVVQSDSAQGQIQLQQLEQELVELSMEENSSAEAWINLRKEMEALEETSPGRQFQAGLFALRSWVALETGERRLAINLLGQALQQDSNQEWVLLMEAKLMDNSQDALNFLKDKPEHLYRLKAYRAQLFFDEGNYGEALVLFDESLPRLPEVYQQRYATARQLSWELKDSQVSADISNQFTEDPITLALMIQVTQSETLLLDHLSRENRLKDKELFQLLNEKGYILENKEPDWLVSRGDAALFLWHLLMEKEDKPEWEFLYREQFMQSPIGDLPLKSPYFDAALGCVEREIMSLPDGVYFYPDLLLPGKDFIKLLVSVEDY